MVETKKIWDKTLVKCYGDNFYRLEDEGDTAHYHIYINNEEVESCPLTATRQEVDMRFHELLAKHGIEDDNMYIRKERDE